MLPMAGLSVKRTAGTIFEAGQTRCARTLARHEKTTFRKSRLQGAVNMLIAAVIAALILLILVFLPSTIGNAR